MYTFYPTLYHMYTLFDAVFQVHHQLGLKGPRTLSSQTRSSDWLKQNTADQWEKENPEVAAEY